MYSRRMLCRVVVFAYLSVIASVTCSISHNVMKQKKAGARATDSSPEREFGLDDDLPQTRTRRLSAGSEISHKDWTLSAPSDADRQNTHVAKRRHVRDVSYFYDNDEERRLRDLLRNVRFAKRQPIDRIDEPSDWRDRLRGRTPGLSDGWYNEVDRPVKRQPLDRIDVPSAWRHRLIPKLKEFYPLKRRTRSVTE